jgi:hypothetical protein
MVEALCRATLFPDLPVREGRDVLLSQLIGTPLIEGLFLLNELCSALHLEGDVCEFGVAQGATSALIANEIRHTNKRLWLFDSFEGLPRPTEKDRLIDDIFNLGSMDRYEGQMAEKQSGVIGRLNKIRFPFERVQIVPGFIEHTSKSAGLPERVCFGYVDFDFYEPILIALRVLASRMPTGGRIMVDDYGFFSEGAEAAVEEFLGEIQGAFTKRLPPEGCGHYAMLTCIRGFQHTLP